MGRLVYCGIGSFDGFIADSRGEFDWSAPDDEVHAYLNERDASVVCELYGRRLYEIMKVWQTYGTADDAPAVEREYGELWRAREKIVYSTTLDSVESENTRLERGFDPAEVRALVDAADGDVGMGGPELAAHALRAGIVDELEYYANPVVLGAGKPFLPADLRLDLRLTHTHTFTCGVVHSVYDVVRG